MKVLIIRGFPEKINLKGYNVQETGLAHALRSKGVVCDIVFFQGKGQDQKQVMEDGTVIYWLHGVNLLKNGIMPELKRIANMYDVLQVHEYDQLESWLVYTFYHKPVVIYHGPYYDPFNRGYNSKTVFFDHVFLPFSGKARERTTCLTKSELAADFLRKKGFQHVKAVGVGFDPGQMETNVETQKMGMTGQEESAAANGCRPLEVIYVGKLEERRNSEFLLKVLRRTAECEVSIHATIVGKGEKAYMGHVQPLLQELCQKGIVTYYPEADQQEVGELYHHASVFLFPSRYDIFGMVLLEAMYNGLCVVSSLNGGSSVLIEQGKNGIILDGFQEDEWVKTICMLSRDPEIVQQFGIRAAERVRSNFLWSALADQFIGAYKYAMENFIA